VVGSGDGLIAPVLLAPVRAETRHRLPGTAVANESAFFVDADLLGLHPAALARLRCAGGGRRREPDRDANDDQTRPTHRRRLYRSLPRPRGKSRTVRDGGLRPAPAPRASEPKP